MVYCPCMQEYITIKEAIELTGKSDATIRRLLRRKLKEDPDAEPGQMIRQEPRGSGFIYTVDKGLLESEGWLPMYPPKQAPTQNQDVHRQNADDDQVDDQADDEQTTETEGVVGSQPPTQEGRGVYSQPLFEALAGTIDVLKNQLQAKDDQLATRDQHIGRLIEDRERTDILLGNLQNRIYALEAPPKRAEQAVEVESAPESGDTDQDVEPASAGAASAAAIHEAAEHPEHVDDEDSTAEAGETKKRRGIWPFSRN